MEKNFGKVKTIEDVENILTDIYDNFIGNPRIFSNKPKISDLRNGEIVHYNNFIYVRQNDKLLKAELNEDND